MKKKAHIKRAEYGSLGETKMATFRLPVTLIEKLDKASKRLGISKTAIICDCVKEMKGNEK